MGHTPGVGLPWRWGNQCAVKHRPTQHAVMPSLRVTLNGPSSPLRTLERGHRLGPGHRDDLSRVPSEARRPELKA